ncbi:MAG: ThiF family adenylyltransferase [Dehalococcoidia bacterium]
MKDIIQVDCHDFYRMRDDRTQAYINQAWGPVSSVRVAIDMESAQTEVGQHLLLSLTNLLARTHRRIIFTLPAPPIPLRTFSLVHAKTLQEAAVEMARAIDPCGTFTWAATGGDFALGIGPDAEVGLDWYLGADRAIAFLATQPAALNIGARGSMRGAGLAACLGAAAAFKAEIGSPIVARVVSAWNYMEGDAAEAGPDDLESVNVGRVLMVGAGAVASGLVYWLHSWGVQGDWTLVDRDNVKLHNTNRGLLFIPSDAGWPAGQGRAKVDLLARLLPRARRIEKWFEEAEEIHDARFDVVLALANEHGVREQLAHRNSSVLLHATTGRNWLSQLHRHVASRDDCIDCRLHEVKEVAFKCSTVEVHHEHEEQVDAALPFLSAASGLMLTTLLQRLAVGALMETAANNWRWDFLSSHVMAARPGRSKCRSDCSSWYPPSVRAKANAGTAWSHLDRSTRIS